MQNKLVLMPFTAAMVFLFIALSGCNGKPFATKTIRTSIDIPAQTFECGDPLTRPSGDDIKESAVAHYINGLEFNEKDCKTRLKEVQVLVKCANEPKCDPKLLVELLRVAKPESSR